MDTVVISTTYQVRIPKHLREALGLSPGQCLRIVRHGGRLELVPLRPAFESAGLFGKVGAPGDAQPPSDRRTG